MGSAKELCDRCKQLATYEGIQQLDRNGSILAGFRHGRYQDILDQASSIRPCPLCVVIRDSATDKVKDPANHVWLRWDRRSFDVAGEFGHIWIYLQLVPQHITGLGTMCLIAQEDDPASSLSPLRPLGTDVASEAVFSKIRSWLETCETTHEECKQPSVPSILPLRLIDVKSSGDLDVQARLVLAAPDRGRHIRYLCLSYCWGAPQRILALRANIHALQEGIPTHELGQTIRDAIETTRRLGFRYLWVDALCIVQDDDAEKLREIKKMSHIYKNATAVLSVASASAHTQGFLRPVREFSYPSFDFTFSMPSSDGNVDVKATMTFAPVFVKFDPQHPLEKRAWTFQEMELPRRSVIFSKVEVLVACNKYPHASLPGSRSLVSYSSYNPCWFRNSLMRYLGHRTEQDDQNQLTWLWDKLLKEYSSRDMTDLNDRLYAFQGIADDFESILSVTARFGTVAAIPSTFAWVVQSPVFERSARAPTWSWGSVDGPVALRQSWGYRYEAQMEFIDDDDDEVNRGLKIHGGVIHGGVIHGADWNGEHPYIGENSGWGDVGYADLVTGIPAPENRTYVRILREGRRPGYRRQTFEIVLILEQVTGREGIYHRCGIYDGSAFDGHWDGHFDDVIVM
ncbi:heterokaryon incompatibility protein-domain-containing protein [Astrocystis sublimbata]|nr:heterokaryon incompatibility protein-domain-containing protein [Astrocystis sublimbata]